MNKLKKFFLVIPLLLLIIVNVIIFIKYYNDFEKLDIRELQSLSFISQGRNFILVGNPDVGKTHTAIGIGIKACMNNYKVLYIAVPNLITELKESMTLKQITKRNLLIMIW